MKKILSLIVLIVAFCILFGTYAYAQTLWPYYHPAMSFSVNKYTNTVDGYPEGTSAKDFFYEHTNTTCGASEADLWTTGQRYGLFGVWVNLSPTYITPANTGSTWWGEGYDTSYAGYRFKLEAVDNYSNGTRVPINIPVNKFVIKYYDHP